MTPHPDRSSSIEQPDGYPTIHVWTNPTGDVWCCAAYDHGPMCRLCQPVDEILDALLENVRDGNMLAKVDGDGQFSFKMTERGNAVADDLVATDPEHAALYAQVATKHDQVKLNPSAEKVLRALYEARDDPEGVSPAKIAETTGLTLGQVKQALSTLASLGFIGAPE